MKTRTLLLAGTMLATPMLGLAALPAARAQMLQQGDARLHLAQAPEGEPRRGREGEGRPEGRPAAPPPAAAPREAPPAQREAPPAPRAAPPAPREAPLAPREAPPAQREAPPAQREAPPAQRVAPPAPPREAPPVQREAPPAPVQREAPRVAPPPAREVQPQPPARETAPPALRREIPAEAPRSTEPPREPPRTQTPPAAERREAPPALERREAPRPDSGRPETQPTPRPVAPAPSTAPQPAQRPDSAPPRPETPQPLPPRAGTPEQRGGGGALAPAVPGLAPPQPRGVDATRERGDRQPVERDGRTYLPQPDNRLIIREGNRDIIRHDEVERLRRGARNVDVQQRPGGQREIVILRPDGDRIVTFVDSDGNLLRRVRRSREGRDYVLIDNERDRPRSGFYGPVVLPPLRLDIPRERYIVEAEDAPYDVIEETLLAPPVERVERAYSLDEVRNNQRLREKVRRVDLDTINFAFGGADVEPNEAARLDKIARALLDAIRRNPNEVFLIEGHTDAVGGDTENLTLSDRRAEAVAAVLTDSYQIPPENLVTQGYGEQFLKVQTQAPERQNRRVTLRRITPLLQQGQQQAQPPR